MISTKKLLAKLVMSTPPTGAVTAYSGATAPSGWLFCRGQAISRTTYAELFAVIGTTYGSGDGSTTFNLPNCQGNTIVGVSTTDDSFDLADKGGEKTHQLTIREMPSHSHNYTYLGNTFTFNVGSQIGGAWYS